MNLRKLAKKFARKIIPQPKLVGFISDGSDVPPEGLECEIVRTLDPGDCSVKIHQPDMGSTTFLRFRVDDTWKMFGPLSNAEQKDDSVVSFENLIPTDESCWRMLERVRIYMEENHAPNMEKFLVPKEVILGLEGF